MLSFLVGAITLVMGMLRLGFLDAIFSKATNRGFITGVAFVVMTEQLLKFFGIEDHWSETSTPIQKFIFALSHMNQAQWLPSVFAVSGLLFLLAVDILKRRFSQNIFLKILPTIMIVVVVSTAISYGLGLDLPVLGFAGEGFVTPSWPKARARRP